MQDSRNIRWSFFALEVCVEVRVVCLNIIARKARRYSYVVVMNALGIKYRREHTANCISTRQHIVNLAPENRPPVILVFRKIIPLLGRF